MLLRHREDLRTLTAITLYWVLFFTAWVVAPTGVFKVGITALLSFNAFVCAVIAHNVVHCPVFVRRWMNRIFQVWLSCSYGFPISDYIPGHNLSHHRFVQKAEDVMRTTKVNYGWNFLNFFLFFPTVTPAILRGNAHYKKTLGARALGWKKQLLLESIVVWTIKIGALLLDFEKGVLYVWIPHLVANFGIVSVNFLQHDGCDEDHPFNHSRNFVGKLENYLLFNNGYHGMHHLEPGLHWTLLPQAHEAKVVPGIAPQLNEPSIVGYWFRAVIWPGKRLRYDGTPVVITDPGADADWVKPEDAVPNSELAASGVS